MDTLFNDWRALQEQLLSLSSEDQGAGSSRRSEEEPNLADAPETERLVEEEDHIKEEMEEALQQWRKAYAHTARLAAAVATENAQEESEESEDLPSQFQQDVDPREPEATTDHVRYDWRQSIRVRLFGSEDDLPVVDPSGPWEEPDTSYNSEPAQLSPQSQAAENERITKLWEDTTAETRRIYIETLRKKALLTKEEAEHDARWKQSLSETRERIEYYMEKYRQNTEMDKELALFAVKLKKAEDEDAAKKEAEKNAADAKIRAPQLVPREVFYIDLPEERVNEMEVTTGDDEMDAYHMEVPQDSMEIPADDTQVLADVMEVPEDDIEVPEDDMGVPKDDMDVPAEDVDVPADNMEVPEEDNLVSDRLFVARQLVDSAICGISTDSATTDSLCSLYPPARRSVGANEPLSALPGKWDPLRGPSTVSPLSYR